MSSHMSDIGVLGLWYSYLTLPISAVFDGVVVPDKRKERDKRN
jgi:hypothetical protein